MKSRLAMVLAAIVLATLATLGIMIYIQSVRAQIREESTPLDVLVARKAIPEGTSVKDAKDEKLIEIKKVPKRYVAEGAYSDFSQLDNGVITVTLTKGEQLTSAKLKNKSQAGLSYRVPKGLVGISIPIDEVIGVSGQVEQGDRVDIIATFAPGPGGADMSKILLQNVEVLSVSSNIDNAKSSVKIGKSSTQGNQKETLTLALTPADAEKLVFAEEKGTIWLTLLPPDHTDHVDTSGQTVESVFE